MRMARTTRMNLSMRLSNRGPVKHRLARVIVCGILLLVLPSCVIFHLRLAEPAPDLPASDNRATSSETSAHLGIDEFFNDPILTHLIDEALAGNRELKIL